MARKLLILYVPVVHQGYLSLIDEVLSDLTNTVTVCVLGENFVRESQSSSEIRAISANLATKALHAMFGEEHIILLDDNRILRHLMVVCESIILSNDDVVRRFADNHLRGKPIEYRSTFLRWDATSVFSHTDVSYDRISTDPTDIERIILAESAATDSGDWWRQVGAVLIDAHGFMIVGRNRHLPSEHTVYIDGDPRDVIAAGTHSELSTALHAEQDGICQAVRLGISLEDASIYLSVYPCPVCAKLIAASGIKAVYFSSGHASLDGETVLRAAGVELIYVKTPS